MDIVPRWDINKVLEGHFDAYAGALIVDGVQQQDKEAHHEDEVHHGDAVGRDGSDEADCEDAWDAAVVVHVEAQSDGGGEGNVFEGAHQPRRELGRNRWGRVVVGRQHCRVRLKREVFNLANIVGGQGFALLFHQGIKC